jgi:hypothetical protein
MSDVRDSFLKEPFTRPLKLVNLELECLLELEPEDIRTIGNIRSLKSPVLTQRCEIPSVDTSLLSPLSCLTTVELGDWPEVGLLDLPGCRV